MNIGKYFRKSASFSEFDAKAAIFFRIQVLCRKIKLTTQAKSFSYCSVKQKVTVLPSLTRF